MRSKRRACTVWRAVVFVLGASGAVFAGGSQELFWHFWTSSEGLADFPARVMRIDLDVTGDGTPELLLANSQAGGNSGLDGWYVYSPSELEGEYRFLGQIGFSYRRFRVSGDASRILVWYTRSDTGSSLVTFRATSTGFVEVSRRAVTSADDERALCDAWREKVGLEVLSVDVRGLAEADPEWIDLLTGVGVRGIGNLHGLLVVE